MKILISSNAPFGMSGYSTQARSLAFALKSLGHEVSFYAWYGLETGSLNMGGIPVYGRLRDETKFGHDAYLLAEHLKCELIITLQDIWPLPGDFGDQCRKRGIKWCAWFPIDGEPLPDIVAARLPSCDYPVVYSRFGQQMMNDAGIECDYIPHGIDTAVFSPPENKDHRRVLRRELFDIDDDTFLVSIVAANVGGRKAIPEAMEAFATFHKRHPNSLLYIHSDPCPPFKTGYWLELLGQQLGVPRGALRFVNQMDYLIGLPAEYIADVYRCSDVLLAASMGEGFGLPIAEAQACGCSVIVQDCTSMRELCVNGIAIQPMQRQYTGIGHWQYVPGIQQIVEALEERCGWDESLVIGNSARGIVNTFNWYTWENVSAQWDRFLQRVETAVAPEVVPA